MLIDRNLNYELNEVWHSSFWRLFSLQQPKNWIFGSQKN